MSSLPDLSDELRDADVQSCEEDSEITTSQISLQDKISDAGCYAYTALFANALHRYFHNEWDTDFSYQILKSFVLHLDLPSQVESTMQVIYEGHHQTDNEMLRKVLLEESLLYNGGEQIVQDFVLFSIQNGVYDARMRIILHYLASWLRISNDDVEYYEDSVVDLLNVEEQEETQEEKQESQRRNRNKKVKRYFMIGLATVGGGALLGLTGGLAAPFVAAGAGALIGGAGAAALGSTAGVAIIGSLFGVAGAGLTGFKMKKRVGAIEEFAFDLLTEANQLNVTIAISGWLLDEGHEFFKLPWKNLLNSREQYCLRYESKYLLELGRAIDYLFSFAVSVAAQEALKYTILSGIITAIAWPASLLTLASVIDNPWSVCIRRSEEVGKQLADVLLSRYQGHRPVTLIGFSLGARVIFYCLQEMSKRKGSLGIIENAILLGAPVTGNAKDWKPLAKVVAGKIINGYCRSDWLLKFLYRTSSVSVNIAGLHPVEWEDRRMHNFDLSHLVSGHLDYSNQMDLILKTLGIRTCDDIANIEPRRPSFLLPKHKLNVHDKNPLHSSKSEGNLMGRKPNTDPYSTDSNNSLSTVDSGLGKTSTDLSLSNVSDRSYCMSKDSLGQFKDFTSQNSLSSRVPSEDADDCKK